ncbi:MAG TPA: aldehyde dehydrogenase family protein [Flavobacteriales bacterium]|nr:aldehyde dehydrogenase family protein [Flavobacteriales bacterium]HRE98462.1 aldehyde dehydrogenase family protein [Flavobacteriales bacterium]
MEKIYLAGEFIATSQQIVVTDPYSGKSVASVCLASPSDVDTAIAKANAVRTQMQDLPVFERAGILRKIAETFTKRREELAKLLISESAKPWRYAIAEVDRAAETFLIASEECKRFPGEVMSLDWTPSGKNKKGIVDYFPIGVIAGITPFNFPFNLVAHKVAPAIAAGCPIILKPASSTPLCALELARIIHDTTLPKGAFSVLPCDRNTGNALVTSNDIQVLSFTGSPSVGWKMKDTAGKKKTVLELGGNAGVFIAADANIDHAVERCLVGAFAYSGQICIHTQRIFVEDKVFEEFVEKFMPRVEMLKTGDPSQKDTELSSMIDEENAIRVDHWVKEAIAAGAKMLCGGNRNGNFYEATILTGTTASMKVHAEEIFGPVVCVEKVNNKEDGIRQLNNTRFGLQAGLFTNDHAFIQKAFKKLEVGGVLVNEVPTVRFDHMPYGGVKDSGQGREGVKYAMLDFLEPKILVL